MLLEIVHTASKKCNTKIARGSEKCNILTSCNKQKCTINVHYFCIVHLVYIIYTPIICQTTLFTGMDLGLSVSLTAPSLQ